jgi:isoleucyl-tRNA synthetase
MSDYKHTLNLPHTTFSMKANLAQKEPARLKKWEDMQLYQQIRQRRADKKKFILHDGPPYANGDIHMGHALNKILKDIVVKSKTLSNVNAPFIPGWDGHGLPIELDVEKKKGKPNQRVSANEFRQACYVYAESQVEKQKKSFKRLGVLACWNQPYLTIQRTYEANIIRALAKVIEQGYLVRADKPVYWCTSCHSALAEAEVEYKDKCSPAIDVLFSVVNVDQFAGTFPQQKKLSDVYVPIWTTTPWTLLANEAVCIHPKLRYALVSAHINHQHYTLLLAEDLLTSAMRRYQSSEYNIIDTIQGERLDGLLLAHPLLNKQVPIILGEHVTTDAGTGNVHTAPAHGQEDYAVGQRYHLPVNNPVNANSCFAENIPFVAGLHVFKSNDVIINLLLENKHLLHRTSLEHSYPHCWRHKTPLIFRATSQWFIRMDAPHHLRQHALQAIKKVKWLPNWGENRITKMVENRPDWCVSRQRPWGTPLPLLLHKTTGQMHPNMHTLLLRIADHVQEKGINTWFDLHPSTLLCEEDAEQYAPLSDVLDVWFDSGVSHFCVLSQHIWENVHYPADLYLEGSDQHRGWFQTSLLSALAMKQPAPYKAVLTHGFVNDEKGYKMSKSLGNTIEPAKIIQQYGADVLRLWAASSDYKNDISISQTNLKGAADAYRRIRNTARFLISNLFDFTPSDLITPSYLLTLDAWAIGHTQTIQTKILTAYDQYDFLSVYQIIHHFCTLEMGSFYLDIIKDRLYTTPKDGIPRRSAQTAMYHILHAFVRWIAPILSFTADEIWEYLPHSEHQDKSVFLSTWYQRFPAPAKDNLIDDSFWLTLMRIREEINKALETERQKGCIGSSLQAELILYCGDELQQQLNLFQPELRFIFITSSVTVQLITEKPADLPQTPIKDFAVKVDVSSCNKCERCWQYDKSVGIDSTHTTLCRRCISNIFEQGEQRRVA